MLSILDIFSAQNENWSKTCPKRSQNRGWKKCGILALRAPWPPDWSQEPGMSPRDCFGSQYDPKMTSELPQNGAVGNRNHSNTSRHLRAGWNREGNPKVVSEQNWRDFRPCRWHFYKQNGGRVPSEPGGCIEKLARIPSM